MPTDKKTIQNLEVAFKTEIAGHLFYNAAAKMISDKKGKNIFKHLAKEELEHMRVLSSIAGALKKGGEWVKYETAMKAGKGIKSLPIFPKRDEMVKRLAKNQTDLNALYMSIESEEAAVSFYSKLLKAANSPVEKVTLTKILEMEKGHLKMLRWESESLINTGFWAGNMEYSVEKEAD